MKEYKNDAHKFVEMMLSLESNSMLSKLKKELRDLPVLSEHYDKDVKYDLSREQFCFRNLGEASDWFIKNIYDACTSKGLRERDLKRIYKLCGSNAEKTKRFLYAYMRGSYDEFEVRENLSKPEGLAIPFINDGINEEGLPGLSENLIIFEGTDFDIKRAFASYCVSQAEDFSRRIDLERKRLNSTQK